MKVLRAVLAASLLVLASGASMGGTGPAVSTAPLIGVWGFDITGVDPSVRPGDDFYRYAGGNWLKTAEISLHGKTPEVRDGFTGEQRYFLGWAQVWRTLQRYETLRNQMLSNPHSPAEARVNGVVRNVDAWYDAYGVTPDAKLYLPPDQRVRIW